MRRICCRAPGPGALLHRAVQPGRIGGVGNAVTIRVRPRVGLPLDPVLPVRPGRNVHDVADLAGVPEPVLELAAAGAVGTVGALAVSRVVLDAPRAHAGQGVGLEPVEARLRGLELQDDRQARRDRLDVVRAPGQAGGGIEHEPRLGVADRNVARRERVPELVPPFGRIREAGAVGGLAGLPVRAGDHHRVDALAVGATRVRRARALVVTHRGRVGLGALRRGLAGPGRSLAGLTHRARLRRVGTGTQDTRVVQRAPIAVVARDRDVEAGTGPGLARIRRAGVRVRAVLGRVDAPGRGTARVRRARVPVVTHHRGVDALPVGAARIGRAGAVVVTHRGRGGGRALGRREVGIRLAHVRRAGADLGGAAERVATLVDRAVAVVVVAVALLGRPRVDGRVARDTVVPDETVAVVVVGHARVAAAVGNAVAVTVVVAQVTKDVAVLVDLVGVGHERAVVGDVGDGVAVVVRVTGVAERVAVRVDLIGVRHQWAVVRPVEVAVVVVVRVHAVRLRVSVRVDGTLVDLRVAVVIETVADLGGADEDGLVEGATVRGIGVQIAVVVQVADVAVAVGIGVRLIGVELARTVVRVVQHPVAVIVVDAGIAFVVLIGVGLVRIRHERTVVRVVRDAVRVVVELAGVAERVAVGVALVRVRNRGAVVDPVRGAVTVQVSVAGVASAVPVRVPLDDALGLDAEHRDSHERAPRVGVGRRVEARVVGTRRLRDRRAVDELVRVAGRDAVLPRGARCSDCVLQVGNVGHGRAVVLVRVDVVEVTLLLAELAGGRLGPHVLVAGAAGYERQSREHRDPLLCISHLSSCCTCCRVHRCPAEHLVRYGTGVD